MDTRVSSSRFGRAAVVGACLLASLSATRADCPADLNGDAIVSSVDFLTLLANWGPCPSPPIPCPADLSGDGRVDVVDFLALLEAWGNCPVDADASVIGINMPATVVENDSFVVEVEVHYDGPGAQLIPVTLWYAGGQPQEETILLEPGQPGIVQFLVEAEEANNSYCGSSDPSLVLACTTLESDVDASNNCQSDLIGVVGEYWDLKVEILNAPGSAPIYPCSCFAYAISWDVKVTNVGNAPAPSSCIVTGIMLNPGASNWCCDLGFGYHNIPPLQPGQSHTWTNSPYFIWCYAYAQTQFIKAKINNGNGCIDVCGQGAGNNFAQKSIDLHFALCQ